MFVILNWDLFPHLFIGKLDVANLVKCLLFGKKPGGAIYFAHGGAINKPI